MTQLEHKVRARIGYLNRHGAHPGRGTPKDRELATQLAVLRSLNPAFAARADALARVPPTHNGGR